MRPWSGTSDSSKPPTSGSSFCAGVFVETFLERVSGRSRSRSVMPYLLGCPWGMGVSVLPVPTRQRESRVWRRPGWRRLPPNPTVNPRSDPPLPPVPVAYPRLPYSLLSTPRIEGPPRLPSSYHFINSQLQGGTGERGVSGGDLTRDLLQTPVLCRVCPKPVGDGRSPDLESTILHCRSTYSSLHSY